jgi:diguanylate cyclase (GGDEF)-like protein
MAAQFARPGFATPAHGQAAVLVRDVLDAPDLASAASRLAQRLSDTVGLQAARVVWAGAADTDSPAQWHVEGAELGPEEQRVVSQCLRAPGIAHGVLGSQAIAAIALVPQGEDGFVAVLWSPSPGDPTPAACLEDPAAESWSVALRHHLANERLRRSVDRLAQAERLQRALYAIADLASADLEMAEMLRGLHDIVGGLMYAENLYIVLYDARQETVRFIYAADVRDASFNDPDEVVHASRLANSLTLGMLRRGRSFHGPSAVVRGQLGVARDESLGPDSEDWLGVPMVRGGQVRGGIVVQSYDAAIRYSDEDRVLLSYVAQHILTALDRRQAHEELERRVEQRTWDLAQANEHLTWEVAERQRGERLQRALFRIAELSTTAETLDQFYREVHAIVGELLFARNFYIALVSDDGTLDFPYSVDEHDPVRQRRLLGSGVTEYVLRSGRALLADRDAIAALEQAGEVSSYGTRSVCWLGVPLPGESGALGVLAVQSYSDDHVFSARDQELLTFVAHHIAQGLLRKRAQDSLRAAYAELEQRVAERTRELADANRELREQIGERERAELRLKHQAQHDALTGLPNRAYLLDRLAHALARYQRDRRHHFAVLFLDLDRFKVINDSVGHLVGDEMLKEAGARIAAALRAPDMVARLGGDEFAILLEDIAAEHDAFSVARRVIDSLAEPIRVGGKELFTSASVGIAVSHPRYVRAEDLLRDADVAMYRAKAKGRQRYEVFDEQLHTEALKLLDLEGDLRRAIARNEFEPHFQAIVDLHSGRTVGYEALLRWRHAERGLLCPAEFLDVAEDSGAVEQIDWQMFDLTCREIPRLTDEHTYVCINVSARHFRSPDLGEAVLALLRVRGIAPSRIRLEVTEGALLENPDQIRRTLERLRDAGVLAQLDDFGTGYSSLSYLHRLPIHSLKIDRSFVQDLAPGGSGSSVAVVRAIRALADSMGLEVIAEGVETEAQREALRELGVSMGQGYLFARPQAVGELVTLAAAG